MAYVGLISDGLAATGLVDTGSRQDHSFRDVRVRTGSNQAVRGVGIKREPVHDPGGQTRSLPSSLPASPLLRSENYLLRKHKRAFHVRSSFLQDCECAFGPDDVSLAANALGRFPVPDYTQVAHLSEQVCDVMLRDRSVRASPQAFHAWDVVTVPGSTQAKVCLQLDTAVGVVSSVSLSSDTLPCGLEGERVVVLLPVFSESDESMELRFGSLYMFPPQNTKFSHFGVSIPKRWLPYVTIVSHYVRFPCFYIKTGNCGTSHLAKYTTVPTVVMTGLDYRSENYCVSAGSPRYALTPLKSGVAVVRVRRAYEFVCGCFSLAASQPFTLAVAFPGVSIKRSFAAYVCFKPLGENTEESARAAVRSVCLGSVDDDAMVTFGRFVEIAGDDPLTIL